MRRSGFTLAEVLITLLVIGVVAAMTIPTIVNNIQGNEYRTAAKKAISGLNNAIKNHYATSGKQVSDYATSEELITGLFKTEMKTINDEELEVICPDNECESVPGQVFITADGIVYLIPDVLYSTDNGACDAEDKKPCIIDGYEGGNMLIDVNGSKGPNAESTNSKQPKDQYELMLYNSKVVVWNKINQAILYNPDKEETELGY